MSDMPIVSLADVSLRFYDRIVFERTRWEIHSNQCWAVVGPNGSGKSTLARAICGRVPVVHGQILYHLAAGPLFDGPLGGRPQDHIAYVSFDEQRAVLAQEPWFHQSRWNRGVSEGDRYTFSRRDLWTSALFCQMADITLR